MSFWEQLAADDETEVRRRIAARLYNKQHLGIAQEWIRRKDASRSEDVLACCEEESLCISRKALSNSKLATIISAIAVIVAAREIIWSFFV